MKKIICILLAIATVFGVSIMVFAEDKGVADNTATNPTTAKADKAALKPKVKKKPGFTGKKKKKGKVIYYSDGKKLKNGVHKFKKHYYLFSKKGEILKGWYKINHKYYLFDRKTGKRVTNKKVDGIRLKKSGRAKKSKLNYAKIRTMIRARKIVKKITKKKDSKSSKRLKCFNWVMKFPYHRYRHLRAIYKKKGWECTFANDTFKKHSGCCVSDACAVAFLFREIGYKKVYVCHDTSHAWASLGKRVFDPVFAESKSFKNNYNAIPKDYRINPSHKRLIG